MVTKNGITIKRTTGYACGPGVQLTSGEITLVVLRTDNRKHRRYLVSLFAKAEDGPRYMQLWVEKHQAKSLLKDMKG